jgi:hypothetical protein
VQGDSVHTVAGAEHAIDEAYHPYTSLIQSAVQVHFLPQLAQPTDSWLRDIEQAIGEVEPVYQESWPALNDSVQHAFSSYASGFAASVTHWHGALDTVVTGLHTAVPTHAQQMVDDWSSSVGSAKQTIEGGIAEINGRIQQRIHDLQGHTGERVKQLGDKVRDEVIHAVGNQLTKVIEEQLVETGVAAAINEAITVCAPELKIALDAVGAAAKILKATKSLF